MKRISDCGKAGNRRELRKMKKWQRIAALAGLLNNIKERSLAEYWGEGVHKNCAVTEVQVTDGKPKILSENVVYYDDEVEPWED